MVTMSEANYGPCVEHTDIERFIILSHFGIEIAIQKSRYDNPEIVFCTHISFV